MPTVQVRKARNRTFSNYTLHEIVVKEITIEYASVPLARGPNSIFSNTNFAKYSMQPRDPRAHTHTRARIRWDQGSDRFRPSDSRRILVLGRGGRANRMQARHEFLFSRSSKYKRVHRLSACLPSSVMPRFDATRVHFIYITTAVSQSRCVFIMLSVSPRNYVNGQRFAFAAMILGITSPFFFLFVLFFFFFSTSCYNYHVVRINEIRYFVKADQAGRLSRTRWINNNGKMENREAYLDDILVNSGRMMIARW